jgi:hypothetical protein
MYLYAKKDLRVAIIVLSAIMFIINLGMASIIDMVLWASAVVVYLVG